MLILLLEVGPTDELLPGKRSLVAPDENDNTELADDDSGVDVCVGVDEGIDEALELELVLGLWTYS